MEGLRDDTKFSDGHDARELWHLGIFGLVGALLGLKLWVLLKEGEGEQEKVI